jgi:hypothetical protein
MNIDLPLSLFRPRPFSCRWTSAVRNGFFIFSNTEREDIWGRNSEASAIYRDPELTLMPNTGLYIERVAFSASCEDYVFSKALDTDYSPRGVIIDMRGEGGRGSILTKPLSFFAFNEFVPINAILTGNSAKANTDRNNQKENVVATCKARVRQTQDFVSRGQTELSLNLSVVAYEILDMKTFNEQMGLAKGGAK